MHFRALNPFNHQRSLQAALVGNMSIDNVPLKIVASAPDFTISAQLPTTYTVSFQQLLANRFPDVPDIGNLTIDRLFLEVQPGQSYTFLAELADQPQPWNIELGPETLTLSNMQILVNYTQGAGFSGKVSGILALNEVQLELAYQFPGPLCLRGKLPSISLQALVTCLCGSATEWPADFDMVLSDSSVLVEQRPEGFTLMLGTHVAEYGNLVLQVGRLNGAWGFILGIALHEHWSLSSLSSALEPLSALQFTDMVLVLSTLQSPGFTFPDMAVFNHPAITTTRITLPGTTSGVIRGMN